MKDGAGDRKSNNETEDLLGQRETSRQHYDVPTKKSLPRLHQHRQPSANATLGIPPAGCQRRERGGSDEA